MTREKKWASEMRENGKQSAKEIKNNGNETLGKQ